MGPAGAAGGRSKTLQSIDCIAGRERERERKTKPLTLTLTGSGPRYTPAVTAPRAGPPPLPMPETTVSGAVGDLPPAVVELIRRAKGGDTAAVDELLAAYRPLLRLRAQRRLGRRIVRRLDASD